MQLIYGFRCLLISILIIVLSNYYKIPTRESFEFMLIGVLLVNPPEDEKK